MRTNTTPEARAPATWGVQQARPREMDGIPNREVAGRIAEAAGTFAEAGCTAGGVTSAEAEETKKVAEPVDAAVEHAAAVEQLAEAVAHDTPAAAEAHSRSRMAGAWIWKVQKTLSQNTACTAASM